MTDLYEDLAPRRRTAVTYALLACAFLAMLGGSVGLACAQSLIGVPVTAAGVGSTVAWIGGVAGLLALAALLLVPETAPLSRPEPAARR